MGVYCYLVIGEEKALLLDTGYGVASLMDIIREITDKPVTVILSHGHIDHANGALQFEEAWLHQADLDVFKLHTSKAFREDTVNELDKKNLAPADFNAKEYVSKKCCHLNMLETGQIFELGDLSCEMVAMEGHTHGSIGLLIKEKHVLLASDASSRHVWLFLDESTTTKSYITMLKRTLTLEFDTFFTGHSNIEFPKADFNKFIHVAEHATLENSKPYPTFPELEGYIYEENGVALVFNKRTKG